MTPLPQNMGTTFYTRNGGLNFENLALVEFTAFGCTCLRQIKTPLKIKCLISKSQGPIQNAGIVQS